MGEPMAINIKDYSKTKFENIKIHKDGIRYLFDFEIEGKRIRKIFKSNPVHSKPDRLKSAYRAFEELKDEIRRKNNLDSDIDLNATINDYWEILKNLKRRRWSDGTLYRKENFYKRYIKDGIGKKKIKEVKSSDITRFNTKIAHLRAGSQKIGYQCLTPIFNLAIEDELITRSPIKKNHRPVRRAIEEKKIITSAVQSSKAVNKAIHKVFKNRHDLRALFLFCFYGRRWRETTKLQWGDIDFDNDTYIIRASSSKVKVDMSFSLPSEVKEALSHFRNTTGDVFPVKRVEKHFDDIRKEPGAPDGFTCHWLRNLYVSTLSELGVEAVHLSAALGHTDTATVRQYLSLQRKTSTKTTNEAMEKLVNINQ
jgi:integrase